MYGIRYRFSFEDGSKALAHYGVKGMKWGEHLFGQLTQLGAAANKYIVNPINATLNGTDGYTPPTTATNGASSEAKKKILDDAKNQSASLSDEEREKISDAIIRGDYGNGEERMQKLSEAGYDYNDLQGRVNEKVWGLEKGSLTGNKGEDSEKSDNKDKKDSDEKSDKKSEKGSGGSGGSGRSKGKSGGRGKSSSKKSAEDKAYEKAKAEITESQKKKQKLIVKDMKNKAKEAKRLTSASKRQKKFNKLSPEQKLTYFREANKIKRNYGGEPSKYAKALKKLNKKYGLLPAKKTTTSFNPMNTSVRKSTKKKSKSKSKLNGMLKSKSMTTNSKKTSSRLDDMLKNSKTKTSEKAKNRANTPTIRWS